MNNATVLIVEDEFAIAELLAMALTDGGYRVVLAANGRQALEQLSEAPPPDLVISDLMMPVLDGIGLLQAMREREPHRHIPCIIMSSIPETAVRKRIQGYAGFIRKPFRLAAVVQLVASVLSGQNSPP
jgi:two-component system response regulator VicR